MKTNEKPKVMVGIKKIVLGCKRLALGVVVGIVAVNALTFIEALDFVTPVKEVVPPFAYSLVDLLGLVKLGSIMFGILVIVSSIICACSGVKKFACGIMKYTGS